MNANRIEEEEDEDSEYRRRRIISQNIKNTSIFSSH